MEHQYWIQEQAPNGGYYDSIGLPVHTGEKEAKEQFRVWAKCFPNRNCRLVIKTIVQVEC
jgi:hypothetical protein